MSGVFPIHTFCRDYSLAPAECLGSREAGARWEAGACRHLVLSSSPLLSWCHLPLSPTHAKPSKNEREEQWLKKIWFVSWKDFSYFLFISQTAIIHCYKSEIKSYLNTGKCENENPPLTYLNSSHSCLYLV